MRRVPTCTVFERHVGARDINYADVLELAGIRLIARDARVANDVPNDVYRLEPIAGATPAQIRIRDGWVVARRRREVAFQKNG